MTPSPFGAPCSYCEGAGEVDEWQDVPDSRGEHDERSRIVDCPECDGDGIERESCRCCLETLPMKGGEIRNWPVVLPDGEECHPGWWCPTCVKKHPTKGSKR